MRAYVVDPQAPHPVAGEDDGQCGAGVLPLVDRTRPPVRAASTSPRNACGSPRPAAGGRARRSRRDRAAAPSSGRRSWRSRGRGRAGSGTCRCRPTASRRPAPRARSGPRPPPRPARRRPRGRRIRSLCARQCIATYVAPASATTANISGSASPPDTSLTMVAPASTAAAGHLGAHRVDRHDRAVGRPAARSPGPPATAPPRPGAAWRRVASTRRRCRGCPRRPRAGARPCAIAASGSAQRPPSENESGVTFTTPISRGRPPTHRVGLIGSGG